MSPVENPTVRLSAIVPNYNHGALVGDAVTAIAMQSLPPDEIIVVDDASTDDSLSVLECLRSRFPMLRIVALERNGGVVRALNRGLDEARGRYVYFGAADDLTLPGLFEKLVPTLEAEPEAAFASCDGEVVEVETGHRSKRPPVRPSPRATTLRPVDVARVFRRIDNWILTGAAVVRKELLLRSGGLDPTFGGFADGYAYRRLAFAHGCCYVPHNGLMWRVSPSGVSRSQASHPDAVRAMLDLALARMREDKAFPPWYPSVFERRWRFAVGRIAASSHPLNTAVLTEIAARGPLDRAVLGMMASFDTRVARLGILFWLALRERPTSFLGLANTWLARQRELRFPDHRP